MLIANALLLFNAVVMKIAILCLRMQAAGAASVLLCVMLPDSLLPSSEAQ